MSEDKERKAEQESRLFVSPIAEPLASDKMSKKLLKLIKNSMKTKTVKRGVKETVKAIKKDGKGYCFLILIFNIESALLLLIFHLLMSYLTYLYFVKKKELPIFM